MSTRANRQIRSGRKQLLAARKALPTPAPTGNRHREKPKLVELHKSAPKTTSNLSHKKGRAELKKLRPH